MLPTRASSRRTIATWISVSATSPQGSQIPLVGHLPGVSPSFVSVLNPRSDGLWTRMNSDDPQDPRARLSELVRYVGWPDQDVSSSDFYRALPHRKGGLALQDEKDLIIGMEVESGAFIRRELHPEKRNGNAFIVLSLKQIAVL